ncbi:MAG TPA: LysM peptidoglycan-binding domain-containing protein [Anaerolineaceae bacterium]|nr:LysM peptidoglycan-binding domain-containing protein [Anaerolineaceae bacterium]
MSAKNDPQSVIDSYKKRQRTTPYLIGAGAILLVVVGIILLVTWFLGDERPAIALFSTATPTPTNTVTPTATVPSPTATNTATITVTPTETVSPTPSGPFEYTVQEGENCWDLAVRYEVDLLVLLAINEFPDGQCPIKQGDKILIPAPDQALPTQTPIPTGVKMTFEYVVQTGDSLDGIASRYNSTVDAILAETNRVLKPNPLLAKDSTIFVGQKLMIPANIVTPTATRPATNTPSVTNTPAPATNTPPAATTAP